MELLVTLAVLAVVLGLAAPDMQRFLARRAVVAHVDAFTSSIRLTRAEAIKRGETVSMCVSSDQATCLAGAGATWDQGWLIFVDRDASGTLDAGDDDQLVRSEPALRGSGGVTTDPAGRTSVTFRSNGLATGAALNITFQPKLSADDPGYSDYEKQVCVSLQGRARSC
ncbi:type IV fimbrial biogenesis protein FimT [Caldimonas brevitalea]|uniref:Type II secretion system protein H n=1 Tax=Caldimonas brevitalea TaxID=413882 RepID=A0A0G3BFA8_9BURK|nr:type IV fimbrial biogenesis protein FimT [Caldimonas brevitalea]